MDILQRIYDLRAERGWSEYRLSVESGIPQSTISSWYKKKIVPTIPSLKRICDAYNITLSQFFADEESAVSLTEKQHELLRNWDCLNEDQQNNILNLIQSINKG